MQLCAAFVVAFGPALTVCQFDNAPGGTPTDAGDQFNENDNDENWTPLGSQGAHDKCLDVPRMPKLFFAKRAFFSLLNTVYFTDEHGQEFGFVESWLGDWKNPFGVPGASFYLKSKPKEPDDGIWRINPHPGENGRWTQEELAEHEERTFGPEGAPQITATRPHGGSWWSDNWFVNGVKGMFSSDTDFSKGNTIEVLSPEQQLVVCTIKDTSFTAVLVHYNGYDSSHDEWIPKDSARIVVQHQHKVSAYMHGKHSNIAGEPWADETTIRDCKGNMLVQAMDGHIMFRNARDADYIQQERQEENTLIIQDLGTPPEDLVRVSMKEPCTPFPPFCAKMGMWNWMLHANEWQGVITQPGYVGADSEIIQITMNSGGGTDMRFLTLFSVYQFTNTRFSPMIEWLIFILVILCCGCVIRCCCCPSWAPVQTESKAPSEETQKLMQTTMCEDQKEPEKQSFFACCSRRGGRGVGLST